MKMSWIRRSESSVALVLIVAMVLVLAGCYGDFKLTKTVYRFNGDVSDSKLVQTIVFWFFLIIPVYDLAMLGDAIVLNLIEFWSGETTEISAVTEEGDTKSVLRSTNGGQEAVLTMLHDGKVVAETHFVKLSDNLFEVRDAQGNLAGKVIKSPAGDIVLTDAEGSPIRTIPVDSLPSAPNI
jgi:hypothetical protein